MTETMRWAGVLPAITTQFDVGGGIDHGALGEHVQWLLQAGCDGIVPLGSLGEGATLRADEKLAVLRSCVRAAGTAPVVPGIAACSTRDAVELAQQAEALGCRGLMVLPAYVHKGSQAEAEAHVREVIGATRLPCMLYNNPIAYGADFTPERIAALADTLPNLRAVKESSGDARRITAIRALCGDRLALFVGLDDMVVEGVAAGASGWVAGLVNALPHESVRLFALAQQGPAAARALYEWFLPLLRLDCVHDFVQRIKLVQQVLGRGSERVRMPRLPLQGAERQQVVELVQRCLDRRAEVMGA